MYKKIIRNLPSIVKTCDELEDNNQIFKKELEQQIAQFLLKKQLKTKNNVVSNGEEIESVREVNKEYRNS